MEHVWFMLFLCLICAWIGLMIFIFYKPAQGLWFH
jgi:hypothetical protein